MDEAYYIRAADSETARGPYNLDKLNTLGEAGQISPETLYYDDTLEAWVALGSNEKLAAAVFPQKKKLSLRQAAEPAGEDLEAVANEHEALSVDRMLADAGGMTAETQHLGEEGRWRHRAASLSVPILALVCFVSAATYIYPSWDIVRMFMEGDPDAHVSLLQRPLLILGVLDLIFGSALVLAATEVFPLLRARAMLGMGFFGFTYWAAMVNGDRTGYYLALCSVAYGIGVFICTLTLNFRAILLASALSLGGVIIFAYFTTFAPLVDRYFGS
ncbi:MAG: hypothetical protein ACLFR7_09815 [Opitutales bacterium]